MIVVQGCLSLSYSYYTKNCARALLSVLTTLFYFEYLFENNMSMTLYK